MNFDHDRYLDNERKEIEEREDIIPFDAFVIPPTNTFENIDCMEMLKKCPDKHFDLAIVDPPYGIGEDGGRCRTRKKHNNLVKHIKKNWDASPPPSEYFEQLFRVSKNQIIFGGNYFVKYLEPKMGWIFWDKQIGGDFSDGELAYTSFDRALKKVKIWNGNNGIARIHPVQKPVKLYRWILNKYAAAGDLILDTHVGSGSSIVACIEGGFNYYGCEIDKDYYDAARRRIARAFRKYELFENEAV